MEGSESLNELKDSDFEIRFYERILEERPHFVQALVVLGDLYTQKGMYEKGLEIDERLVRLRPNDPVVLYNLACSYSLTHQIGKGFETIKAAIANGYEDYDYLLSDSDLDNLRKTKRFRNFFSKITGKNKEDKL